jgi:hypothetical protein
MGYGAARGQQLIERARLAADADRARVERAQAEEERRRLIRTELAARREGLYLEYLKALDEYILMTMRDDVGPGTYQDWWQRFQALDNQMDLFALEKVIDANRILYSALEAVSLGLHSSQTFAVDVRKSFAEHREEFEAARGHLVNAMRLEITGARQE